MKLGLSALRVKFRRPIMPCNRPMHNVFDSGFTVNGRQALLSICHGELREWAMRVGDRWWVIRIAESGPVVREFTEVSNQKEAIDLLRERLHADRGEEPVPRAELRRVPFAATNSKAIFSAYELQRPIACIGASRGDFLIYAHWLDGRPEMYGRVRELSLEDYEALRGLNLEETVCGVGPRSNLSWLSNFLGHRGSWGKRLKVFYSRLLLIKPWGKVSEPITAAGDEGAIYELLHQTGCKLPEEA